MPSTQAARLRRMMNFLSQASRDTGGVVRSGRCRRRPAVQHAVLRGGNAESVTNVLAVQGVGERRGRESRNSPRPEGAMIKLRCDRHDSPWASFPSGLLGGSTHCSSNRHRLAQKCRRIVGCQSRASARRGPGAVLLPLQTCTLSGPRVARHGDGRLGPLGQRTSNAAQRTPNSAYRGVLFAAVDIVLTMTTRPGEFSDRLRNTGGSA